jgi:hypothetical protein
LRPARCAFLPRQSSGLKPGGNEKKEEWVERKNKMTRFLLFSGSTVELILLFKPFHSN